MSKNLSKSPGIPRATGKQASITLVPTRKPSHADKSANRTFRDPKMRELFAPDESGASN